MKKSIGIWKRVEEFDKNVVFAEAAPDIEEYKKYYEEINPATAEEIYRQVVEQIQYDAAIVEYANIYRKWIQKLRLRFYKPWQLMLAP